MHAVILAGGSGTRLRPLTYARRKELVPLLNRPLLEYRLRNLRDHGVTDIVLACSQGAGEIEQHFGDGAPLGVRLRYAYEERPLGSGRAVKEAARAAGAAGTLAVCNGDILTNIDLTAMLARHRETGATLSMSLAPVDDPWHFGVVAVDAELRISKFVEKPPQGEQPSNLINAGTWLWEPEMLDRIPDDESAIVDGFSERVLFPGIIADGLRAQGFVEDLWVDVGAPDRYLRATRLLLERETARRGRSLLVEQGAQVAAGAEFAGNVLVGEGATLAERVRIIGPSVIGERAVVGAGAVIERSVLWEDVRVGAGAVVRDSIIAARAVVGERAVIDDAILADGARVPDGVELDHGARLMPGETAGEASAPKAG
jgi:NDP-sugar pyrophosphorylase family protein